MSKMVFVVLFVFGIIISSQVVFAGEDEKEWLHNCIHETKKNFTDEAKEKIKSYCNCIREEMFGEEKTQSIEEWGKKHSEEDEDCQKKYFKTIRMKLGDMIFISPNN